MEAKAELDAPTSLSSGGNTPLHLAIARNYTNVAMVLLHAGADFDLANSQGYTPIHLASREGLLGKMNVLPGGYFFVIFYQSKLETSGVLNKLYKTTSRLYIA